MLSDARARSLVVGSIALLSVTIVLLALVTLSTPLIKPIAFVTAAGQQSVLGISSASASLSLGLWGACLRTSATATACSKPALGFHNLDFGPVPGASKLASTLDTPAVNLLVLHPIALFFALVALPALIFGRRRPLGLRLAVIASSVSTACSVLALLVDFALASAAKLAISLLTPLGSALGPAFWLMLVATGLSAAATWLQLHLRRATLAAAHGPTFAMAEKV